MQRYLWVTMALLIWAPGPVRAQAESADKLTEVARVPYAELVVGDAIAEWSVVAISKIRRLFDGRPTEEPCGYTQDITVQRPHPSAGQAGLAADALERRGGKLAVTCVREGDQLVAGPMRLLIAETVAAEAPTSAPAEVMASPTTGHLAADTSASPSTGHLATDTPASPSATHAETAAADSTFEPADPATVTKMPEPIDPIAKLPAPPLGPDGALVEGWVQMEVEVTRTGETRGVKVLQGLQPTVDDMSVAAVQKLRWKPAEASGVPVDVVVTHSVEWVNEPPPAAGPVADETPFYKGELSTLGSVQLVNARNSVGVGFGVAIIDGILYGVVRPDLNLHIDKFSLGLGTPLRFEVYDGTQFNLFQPDSYGTGFDNVGRFRTQDWDHALAYPYTDLLQPLRYLSWGRKEDNFFVDINRVRALTIGHGQLIRRYAPNVDIEDSNLFAELDAYGDPGGIELIVGPLPIPRVAGGLLFVKPLGLFMDDYLSKSLSIGLSYATDLNAPTQLTTVADPSSGRLRYPIDSGRFLYRDRDALVAGMVQGAGIDTEIKVVKWEFIDLKLYVDYSQLFLPGVPEANIDPFSAGGATLGSLLRMSFGSRPVRDLEDEEEPVRLGKQPREMTAAHAARFRLEARTFAPQYLPSYFNTLYEVERFQLDTHRVAENERATLPTKIAYLASQAGEPWRAGFYLEATYTWVDRLALTAIYEDAWKLGGNFASVVPARNVVLHAETQGLGFLQLFATYHYRSFELEDWGKILQFSTDNEVLYLGGRLQILILAFNLGVQRGLRLDFLDEDAGTVQLDPNGPFLPHTSVGMQNQWNFMFDVELGWQF